MSLPTSATLPRASSLTSTSDTPTPASQRMAFPIRPATRVVIRPFDPTWVPAPEQGEKSTFVQRTDEGIVPRINKTVSRVLGFRETWSLTLFIIFAGALVGFVLARSMMLDSSLSNYKKNLPAGEMFWNSRAPYRYAFIIHVWVCFFGTFGVVFQFLPAVLKNYISLHRLNGYITLLLTGINVATGWVLARRAFGGVPQTQLMFYVLGLLTLISATLGMIYVRDIRQHRKWMLRMTSMLGVIVSGRVIMLAARAIITNIGTFYALFNCEEIQALIHSVSSYPACVAAQQANTNFSSVYVGIHASMHGDKVNRGAVARLASPVGLWTALIIHIIGVEIYIRLTEKQNNHAEGFLLTRKENPYGPIGNP